jgi:tubulin-specific chaperone D
VEAYLEYLRLEPKDPSNRKLDLETAICTILYTLCKVRGHKVIVGFFNNEPRYLESILGAVERTISTEDVAWQVPYVLLLWLSHLLLTPFDLASISSGQAGSIAIGGLDLPSGLPSVSLRCLRLGMHYLPTSTKAQDAAAAMLVRLSIRPDMQKLRLADALVQGALKTVQTSNETATMTVYEQLGPLRFLAGIATSAEVDHLIPSIYRACETLVEEESSSMVSSNAVAKKVLVKIFRNIAILSLRSASAEGPLLSFLQTTSVLEDVIDYLLRSLGDRDTLVRYAAAKAISLIVQELDPEMGYEVIQAVLVSFKEDMPRHGHALDFRTANALKWHGLTLALGHALFKRTASPEQLPDIVRALVSALQFEQRTATGSSVGTNVRDAANFGIWSLSRRYTTAELFSVDTQALGLPTSSASELSIIQTLAIELILSACLDPAGNIRRGSSAALQELVGRHPNQVYEGIALVQIVDYQAVGLRRRAMVDVASRAASLHAMYWQNLARAVPGWRGIGSADVPSREAAAASIARLTTSMPETTALDPLQLVVDRLKSNPISDAETGHGFVLSLAYILEEAIASSETAPFPALGLLWALLPRLSDFIGNFAPRVVRSELPAAVTRLLASLCGLATLSDGGALPGQALQDLDAIVERLLARHEDTILQTIPSLVQALLQLKRKADYALTCISAQTLCKKVALDSAKSTLGGAGRAIALGALAPEYEAGLTGEKALSAIATIAAAVDAVTVDWRTVAVRALQLAVDQHPASTSVDLLIVERIANAVHRGLRDYTIDERGDVGSLVRLQTISCTSSTFSNAAFTSAGEQTQVLQLLRADIARLSLEKLDKVRLQAAQCRQQCLVFDRPVTDIGNVSTYEYFFHAIAPLRSENRNIELERAILEGCISGAGISAESLLVESRAALADTLHSLRDDLLAAHLNELSTLLKSLVAEGANIQAALELLAFLLDMQIPQRLSHSPDFKWRNLLSTIQISHYKSSDVPRILSAIRVYRVLADGVPAIRYDVLVKLVGMLKTNPYPRVRLAVAETILFLFEGEREVGDWEKGKSLREVDWKKPLKENREVVEGLEGRLKGRYLL